MTHEAVVDRDWREIVERLGGAVALEASARQTQAFLRARVVDSAVTLLRLILAYCLSQRGLRCTAAWAASIGLVDISNVALLYRLRRCGDWLAVLVGRALTVAAPQGSRGRLIRIVDATTVPKAGTLAKTKNRLWRIHSAFDLPGERFGFFELTDQQGGETLDRWLGKPGVELNVLIATLRQRGVVRLFPTTLHGEYGTETEVEVSAVSVIRGDQTCYAFSIRDVGPRPAVDAGGRSELPQSADHLTELVGRMPLREIIRDSTDVIERLCIQTALELCRDNRAQAAEMLGLSRQSLYVKLRRFGLAESEAEPDKRD